MPSLVRLAPWLNPSARVDLLQVLAGVRPALRTEVDPTIPRAEVSCFSRSLGLYAVFDEDGFVVLARRPAQARRILSIDRSPGDHTFALGRALGYPWCCCRAAARVGDAGLDGWGARFRRPVGRFRLIDPSAYQEGRALVSHIPCSPVCAPSLRMAEAALRQLPL